MIFSRAAEYAIQAMLYLAKSGKSKGDANHSYVQTKEIADSHDIPYYFLAKIVQDLARAELISSSKGPAGGITLTRKPNEITILNIIAAVDSTKYLSRCVIGFPDCAPETPCPLHYDWQEIKEKIFGVIEDKTLEDLVAGASFINGRLMVPLTKGIISVELPSRPKS